MRVGLLEKGPLAANNEDRLITLMWLHFAQLSDQLDRVAPAEVSRKFTSKQVLMEQLEIMPEKCTHPSIMNARAAQSCIGLLTHAAGVESFLQVQKCKSFTAMRSSANLSWSRQIAAIHLEKRCKAIGDVGR
jgi:hypothetical protein